MAFYIKKFPITGKDGIQYLAKIEESFYDDLFFVWLYTKRRFLWGFKCVNGPFPDGYRGNEWDYDFIKMARTEVIKLEVKIRIINERNHQISKQINNFFEWNGDMREEDE